MDLEKSCGSIITRSVKEDCESLSFVNSFLGGKLRGVRTSINIIEMGTLGL